MASNRRSFLAGAGAAAGLTIVPRHVLGGPRFVAPSDKVTTACIGVGAQGTRVMTDFLKEPDVQIVAVCDVNTQSSDYSEWGKNELRDRVREVLGDSHWGANFSGPTAGREPARQIVDAYYARATRSGRNTSCASYADFRDILKRGDIDAVIIGTPDHWHAPISIAAMKAGKHVYCQKPLTHCVEEARRMTEVAAQTGVATQVATGNSASEETRLLQEWIGAGVIGPVRRVHNWSGRPYWPQGINRPEQADAVPQGFDWDLWLGPAPQRPFNHVYLPFVWRGWYDFGTGALGDMGLYSFDAIFRALKLGAPSAVEASSTQLFPETFPAASIIHYYFPERGPLPPVHLTWYDGGLKPPRPAELDAGAEMSDDAHEGLLFEGDHGAILCGFEGGNPRLIPEARMKSFVPPPKTLPRSIGHNREWIEACKGGKPGAANFGFSGPVTASLLLGNVALRTGQKLAWDPASFRFVNSAEANKLLAFNYREPWRQYA